MAVNLTCEVEGDDKVAHFNVAQFGRTAERRRDFEPVNVGVDGKTSDWFHALSVLEEATAHRVRDAQDFSRPSRAGGIQTGATPRFMNNRARQLVQVPE